MPIFWAELFYNNKHMSENNNKSNIDPNDELAALNPGGFDDVTSKENKDNAKPLHEVEELTKPQTPPAGEQPQGNAYLIGGQIYYEVPSAEKQRPTYGKWRRPSMSEASFRRYEPFIALAAFGSYVIDPQREPLSRSGSGVGPHTFSNGFRDAMIAYLRYGYRSHLITNTDSVPINEKYTPHEQDDNKTVFVENKTTARLLSGDELDYLKSKLLHGEDPSSSEVIQVEDLDELLGRKFKEPKENPPQ